MWPSLLDFFKSIDWNQVLPWLGLIWTLLIFFGWDRRRMQFENEKLRLEIEQLRKKGSPIYLPTPEEIDRILRKNQELTGKIADYRDDRAVSFRNFSAELSPFLVKVLSWYHEMREDTDLLKVPEAGPLYEQWMIVRPQVVHLLDTDTIADIDLVLSYLFKFKRDLERM